MSETEILSPEELQAIKAAIANYSVKEDELTDLFENRSFEAFTEYGGLTGIAEKLKVNLTTGIDNSPEVVAERQLAFGKNVLPSPPMRSLWDFCWEAFKEDPLLHILTGASIISIGLGVIDEHERSHGWIEGFAIFVAVIIVTLVTGVQDWKKQSQFRSLEEVKDARFVKVKRGGTDLEISVFDIVVGDIVNLGTGDYVPADGVFVQGSELKTDESCMTGEIDMIKKNEKSPFLLAGTSVANGVGTFLATGVGLGSQWGKALKLIKTTQAEGEKTPLQVKLATLADFIGKIGLVVAIISFIALIIFWIAGVSEAGFEWSYLYSTPESVPYANGISPLNAVIIAVTILVVAIPEGLPLAVTISLAFSMKKMMADNNLVRHLESCETMGGATYICTDKTGTLTQNRMTVVAGWYAGKYYDEDGDDKLDAVPDSCQQIFKESAAINSTAFIQVEESDGNKILNFIGNKTEGALLLLGQNYGGDYESIRKSTVVSKVFPFSSAKKRMSTVVQHEGGYRMFTKGASEIVLALCTSYSNESGQIMPITDELRVALLDHIVKMADKALRTLCLAFKDLAPGEDFSEEAPETDLVLNCIVGIKDPLRPGVREAVGLCKSSGIRVIMVTGDNIITGRAIARECGILTEGGLSVEGPEFRSMNRLQRIELVPKLCVMARSSPTDKYDLVCLLKELDQVVASSGDGANDAPQLAAAHVGLAMGIAGTEIAKEASDIIILDDNFTSIVAAIKWGRTVFSNVRKFLQFQLTVNVVAMLVACIAAVSGQGVPLRAIQLLWVNLIMDTLASLALGTEAPTNDLLARKPYGKFEPLLNRLMWRNILSQSIFQLVVLFVLLYTTLFSPPPRIWDTGSKAFTDDPYNSAYSDLSTEEQKSNFVENNRILYANTIIFNTFVWCQIFNEANARILGTGSGYLNPFVNFFSNPWIVGVIVITVVLQIGIIYLGGDAFVVRPLEIDHFLVCVLLGAISLPLGVVTRLFDPEKIPFLPAPRQEVLDKMYADSLENSIKHAREAAAETK